MSDAHDVPTDGGPAGDARRWLDAALRRGVEQADAVAAFDRLKPVAIRALMGRWRGVGLATGHPLDGVLEACGWYGKRFDGADAAFPLLFGAGGAVAIDPARLPLRLAPSLWRHARPLLPWAFRALRPALATRRPSARLRLVVTRGKLGAAMIYDTQPVIDAFRQVEPGCLLGMMDCRWFDAPLFFVLRRA